VTYDVVFFSREKRDQIPSTNSYDLFPWKLAHARIANGKI